MVQAWGRSCAARFAVVGLAMTALHLVVFRLVSPWSVPEVANVVAFLTATQVNFALSYSWTWAERRPLGGQPAGHVLRRAVLFTGSAALGFGVNAAVFSVAYRVAGIPPTASVLVATAVAAVTTFLLGSRVVFAAGPVPAAGEVLARTEVAPRPESRLAPAPTADGARGRSRSTGLPVRYPLEKAAQ